MGENGKGLFVSNTLFFVMFVLEKTRTSFTKFVK